MKRFFIRLKHYLFPTAGNGYRPGIFSRNSVLAIIAVLLCGQIAWFAVTALVLKNPNFLAAILPGALTALTNTDRATNGVPALATNDLLTEAAKDKASDMAAKGYFSHVSPDGTTPWHWIQQVGYQYTYAGENLAVDFTDSTDVEIAWMNSPAHRANIVKPQYTEIGIGVASGIYQGRPATFVVQFFGTPAVAQASAGKPATAAVAPAKSAPVAAATTTGAPQVLGEASTAFSGSASGSGPGSASHEGSASVSGSASAGSATPGVPPAVNGLANGASEVIDGAAASPDHTLLYVVGGVLALIALLFLIAIVVKVRVQYLEVVFGGLLLLSAAGASFYMAEERMANAHVLVPADSQAASVYVGAAGADEPR